MSWTYVTNILNGEGIVGTFYKNKFQKISEKEFRIEKVTKRKGDKLNGNVLNVKWKRYNNSFNNWIDKRDIIQLSEYFPRPNFLEANRKVELDLSNYVIETDFKNVAGVDTSSFAKKTGLASLKSNVNKLDIDKLKNVQFHLSNLKIKVDKLDANKLVPLPVDLSKLSDAVKNHVVILNNVNNVNKVNNVRGIKKLC